MLAVPATVAERARPPAVPVFRFQLLLGVVSPKRMLPTVLAPSSVTVASALRSSFEKSAIAPTPLGIESQLVASFQLPPSGLFQTEARAMPAPRKKAINVQARTAAPNEEGMPILRQIFPSAQIA